MLLVLVPVKMVVLKRRTWVIKTDLDFKVLLVCYFSNYLFGFCSNSFYCNHPFSFSVDIIHCWANCFPLSLALLDLYTPLPTKLCGNIWRKLCAYIEVTKIVNKLLKKTVEKVKDIEGRSISISVLSTNNNYVCQFLNFSRLYFDRVITTKEYTLSI